MRLIINQDTDPLNPLDEQDVCELICHHPRYTLGTQQDWEADEGDVSAPLYLHDHSGLIIATTPFQSKWDSGRIGLAVVEAEHFPDKEEAWIRDHLIEGVVEEYNDYLQERAWGYQVYETCDQCGQTTERIDSCWGFLGDKEEVKDAMSVYLNDDIIDQFDEAWRKRYA